MAPTGSMIRLQQSLRSVKMEAAKVARDLRSGALKAVSSAPSDTKWSNDNASYQKTGMVRLINNTLDALDTVVESSQDAERYLGDLSDVLQ